MLAHSYRLLKKLPLVSAKWKPSLKGTKQILHTHHKSENTFVMKRFYLEVNFTGLKTPSQT